MNSKNTRSMNDPREGPAPRNPIKPDPGGAEPLEGSGFEDETPDPGFEEEQ